MNTDVFKGKWQQLKGEAKVQWGKLTDDDIDQIEGNAQKLVGKVQERYGYARDRAEQEVDQWISRDTSREVHRETRF
jgi:uncharacterized protein YjbJ (UPF0337 family)